MAEEQLTTNIITLPERIEEYFSKNFSHVLIFIWNIILALIIFAIGAKLIRWATKKLHTSLEKTNLNRGVIQFFSSMTRFVAYFGLIFGIAEGCGVSASSIASIIAAAGVTIGLALQGGLANITGGIMILMFHPFQVGDYIIVDEAKGYEGTVTKIEIYYTTINSIDNRRIVIPNGVLAGNTVTNVTAEPMRRLELKFDITYESDMKKAKKVLEKHLKQHRNIRKQEDLLIFVSELGAHAVTVGFRVWVETSAYWETRWRLNEEVKDAFDKAGIVFAYNQVDVHLYQKKVIPEEEMHSKG